MNLTILREDISISMVLHMKTTIELSDALLASIRELAHEEGTTLRALVEEGLRGVLVKRRNAGAFELRRAAFEGKGLTTEFRGAGWDKIRGAAYKGRGS